MSTERLNKLLAFQLGISRRSADNYIAEGKILINDVPAILGSRVNPGDTIKLNGRPINRNAAYQYIILNKPTGYVCSRRSQNRSLTLYSLLPKEYHPLKTVGRLDKDSSGLILLTNDGQFSYRMTHPKFHKTKVYNVKLDKPLQPLHQQMISDYGITLEDGTSRLILEKLGNSSYQVTMSEGRNRQIRRTFASLGYKVIYLHRLKFGVYSLDDLKPGEWQTVKKV